MTKKLITRDVLVKLDDAAAVELLRKSKKTERRADDLLDKLKEHVATEKARIATLRAEAERDQASAAAGEMMQAMKVYEVWQGSVALVYSAETDEQVATRTLTPEERQVDAFPGLDDGGPLDGSTGDDGDDAPAAAATPKKRGRKS